MKQKDFLILVTFFSVEKYGLLVQVEWGQGYPYNAYCPNSGCLDNQGHALAGCVAVTCAQIMSYHKYPSVLGGYSLEWNNMTAFPSIASLSSAYQDQIGRLMYHAAVGVYMSFGCLSSSSIGAGMAFITVQ